MKKKNRESYIRGFYSLGLKVAGVTSALMPLIRTYHMTHSTGRGPGKCSLVIVLAERGNGCWLSYSLCHNSLLTLFR